jgi:hypothetical protein
MEAGHFRAFLILKKGPLLAGTEQRALPWSRRDRAGRLAPALTDILIERKNKLTIFPSLTRRNTS